MTAYLYVLPAIAFVTLTMLYPLGYMVSLGLREVTLGNFLTGAAPFVGLDVYARTLTDPEMWRSLLVSLGYTAGSIGLALVAGYGLALFFARRFPGSGLMRSLLLLGWVLPTVVTGTVWRWMLEGESGIVNELLMGLRITSSPVFWLTQHSTALPAVIVASAWTLTPFAMILLLAGLQQIPQNLYEAARIDGAGPWRRFRYVTLPLMRPVATTVTLLCFIFTFKTFDNVFVMTRGGPGEATGILPIRAYKEAFQFFRFSDGAAITMVLLVISLLIAFVYARSTRREVES